MSAEGVAKVFEEYTQAERSTSANYGGTGLGLPISKRFAEMMGGDVSVSSEEGVGSVFSIYVPRECPEINEEIEEGVINLDSTDNVVVLVDDDAAMHGLIKRTIAKLNLTLIGATNGEKGMDLIREIKPKLILLDEPAAGLDTAESQILGGHLREFLNHDMSVFLIDHDMGLVLSVCDYIYVLDFGKIIAAGTPAEIRESSAVKAAYLGEQAGEIQAQEGERMRTQQQEQEAGE